MSGLLAGICILLVHCLAEPGYAGVDMRTRQPDPSLLPYLCGPINGCTDDEAMTWHAAVREFFPNSIDPMVRDYRGVERACYREIVELDKQDVRNCDVVVVNYVKPSVGTAMEVFYAHSIGKPIILWCAEGAEPSLSPWLRYHATCIVLSLEGAVEAIHTCAWKDPR